MVICFSGDPGGHYHHVESNGKGTDQVVNGRYGFRDPENPGRELTVEYTAGNRGFRARGPHIHRKMDLAQGGPYYKYVQLFTRIIFLMQLNCLKVKFNIKYY